MSLKRVYILILNWNGWGDTIECLESVFRLDYPHFRVIVCDNDSHDGSMEKIQAWAEGKLDSYVSATNPLRELSFPPLTKPVEYVLYNRSEAETCGGSAISPLLILIHTGANLGFAGGNNVGLRHALSRSDFDYVWLLNNDTVVRPDALTWMVKRMEERTDAGMCGSRIPFYEAPESIWALGGGSFNIWTGNALNIGYLSSLYDVVSQKHVESKMSYVAGASMLVSNTFLKKVGTMNEDYFLYFEEIDWAKKGQKLFSLTYSPQSMVFHKTGASTALMEKQPGLSNSSKYYMLRGYVLFTWKYYPIVLPWSLVRFFISRVKNFYKSW